MDYSGVKRSSDEMDAGSKRQKTEGESKVLHVRGLPAFCTEEELTSLVAPFGTVVKCLILAEKHQAFVEMASMDQAAQLLSNLEYSQPTIRSKAVYFQYSSRKSVEVKNPRPGMVGSVAGVAGGGSPTLLITVSNVAVPVTLENIVQICKPYGEVLKVITFQKGNDFQALVQMHSVEAATQAMTFLEGKDMFQGCCHLKVGFSKRHNLIVKQNNQKSRDFTVPQVSAYDMGMSGMMGGPGGYGMDGMGMGGMGGQDQYGMGGGMGGQDFGAQQYGRGFGGYGDAGAMGGAGSVVLVSELNKEQSNPDTIATLFGVYGDVLKVKVLYNKRNTALVQLASPQQAQYVLQHLNNCPLQGTHIKVASSKFSEVTMPRNIDSDDGLTKDYSDGSMHRFKGRMINPKNVNSPNQVLHCANLYDGCTEQELRDLFSSYDNAGTPVVEFFKTSRKMCYVGMPTLEGAVAALVALHNYNLSGCSIRVSFSPKDINTLTNSDMS